MNAVFLWIPDRAGDSTKYCTFEDKYDAISSLRMTYSTLGAINVERDTPYSWAVFLIPAEDVPRQIGSLVMIRHLLGGQTEKLPG